MTIKAKFTSADGSMRFQVKEVDAFEGLSYLGCYEDKIMVRLPNGKFRHYAYTVTQDGRVLSRRCGEMKTAEVTMVNGSNAMVCFSV